MLVQEVFFNHKTAKPRPLNTIPDVDSVLLFPSSLAVAKYGSMWEPAPMVTQNIPTGWSFPRSHCSLDISQAPGRVNNPEAELQNSHDDPQRRWRRRYQEICEGASRDGGLG